MAVGGEKSVERQNKIITRVITWLRWLHGELTSRQAHGIGSVEACCCSSGAMAIEASIHRFLRMYGVFFSYFPTCVQVHILAVGALELLKVHSSNPISPLKAT